VKHEYLQLWRNVQKSIKQLNFLYRTKAPDAQINNWEKTFTQHAIILNHIREKYFGDLLPYIYKTSTFMQEELKGIEIEYKRGWPKGIELSEQLKRDRLKNLQYGQLQQGPHKMDLKITIKNNSVSQILSRGQKKILSITLYMAYVEYTKAKTKTKPIICLDDFDAELDKGKLKKAADFFIKTQSQIFITTVNRAKIQKAFPDCEMFHVKQ
jgi:DNA replication and repair protein RecF